MNAQLTVVGFDNYRISCVIGIEPHERMQEQEILVDVKVHTNYCNTGIGENISHTVDYVVLAEICKETACTGKYYLIETYAADVLEMMIHRLSIQQAWIRVKKPAALPRADYAFVEMVRKRE